MSELNTQLQNVFEKLQTILKQYQLLQKENVQLKKELEKRQTNVSEKEQQIAKLRQETDALKIGVQHWNNDDKKALEKRIDTYLREIEKCLSLLNA